MQARDVAPTSGRVAVGAPDRVPPVLCTVRLFGPLMVICGNDEVDLGPPKQRALFAALAVRAGEVVSTDRLVEALWGDGAPRTATHSVQIYVSGLRKALHGVPGAPLIGTSPPGYRLSVAAERLDLSRFVDLVAAGRERLRAGAASDAVVAWTEALDLWRGEPLAEFAYDDFAQPHVQRLHDLRAEAIEGLAAGYLATGDVAEAARMAASVVADDPTNERAVGLLMRAQYRSGRHVDALRTFRRHGDALGELGLVPGPSLDHLHQRILLHDPALDGGAGDPEVGRRVRNPYKGLRPFGEEDAADYFGRDALVAELVQRVREGRRLIAVVGPSGSGKSSAVAAGLLPRLRAGELPGSERLLIASFVPGASPLRETDAVIAREAGTRPAGDGSLSSMLNAVPATRQVLLVIDQFELLFMTADDATTSHYLDLLAEAVADPANRVTVILTLRADHYDGPLRHPRFAAPFTANVVNVLPMGPTELTAAVTGPAEAAGIEVEPDFVAAIVADTVGQPSSLPLLQYALAEQVDTFPGCALNVDEYRQLGGIRAALSRRADELYAALDASRQRVAEQLLLRMVRVGHGVGDASRRVTMAELSQLGLDPLEMSDVLERLVRHRLVVVGRDPVTDGPLVGLAHDALLDEWRRLADWVDRYRQRLRRYETLRIALNEWEHTGRDDDALLTGALLREAARWRHDDTALRLTAAERAFIDASVARDAEEEAARVRRLDAQRRLEQRARRRLVGLAAVSLLLVATVTTAVLLGGGGATAPHATLFFHENSPVSALIEDGFDRAVTDFGLTPARVVAREPNSGVELAEVAADQDVVVEFSLATDVESVARTNPDTAFVVFDRPLAGPNITSISFAANEASYLAGAAAALASTTGTIGFIGGLDTPLIWEFHAGFEAGARAVDPDVRILAEYLGGPTDYDVGFVSPPLGAAAAGRMFAQGADVVFPAAGASGLGALEAAAERSQADGHLWVIGVDFDQFLGIVDLPGVVDSEAWRPHILTSVIKDYSTAVYETLRTVADRAHLPSSLRLGLAERGVDLSYSGGFIDDLRPRLEALRTAIIRGDVDVPCRPTARPTTLDAQQPTCVEPGP